MTSLLLLTLTGLAVGQVQPLLPVDTWTNGLESPARLTVASGTVYVVDAAADAIVRLDVAGNVLGSWPVPGGPVAVAVHPDGRIFVARRDAQVAVYDAGFNFLRFIDPVIGSFVKLSDLAVDPVSGRLWVADGGGDRFYAFDSSETLALIVGIRGGLISEFKYPGAIAVDPVHDRVAVADLDNFRIQLFDTSGAFLLRFGYRIKYLPGGADEGWLTRTAGLAFDADGNLLVTDALMGTVRLFSPTGTELGKLAGYGTGPGALQTPGGIAFDAAGRVLVADSGGGAVEVYDPPVLTSLVATTTLRAGAPGYNVSPLDQFQRIVPRALIGIFPTATLLAVPGWDPPHMLDDVICGRCHGINGQPGGHLGLIEGQANLCFSCHTGAGPADGALMRPTANVGMSHAWGVDAVNPAYGSVGPAPGGVMAPYLDGGKIKCATCHEQHNSNAAAPFLRAPADAMCSECHAGHANHTVRGSWQPGCTDCHAAHDADDRNLGLVKSPVLNETLDVEKPVVFTARTGAGSFDDGDPAAFDGICQVCHTSTTHHRHDGTGSVHFDGQDCTGCHPHANGFLPAGGDCTGCHAVQQGIRRPVVGEFPTGSAHAHYGAELNPDACLVCHSVDTHMNGYVELLDADTGGLYSFQQPGDLAHDPDLSDFCASCHDADGAARLPSPQDPFGNGNAPPDIATKFAGTLQWYEEYSDFCYGTDGTRRGVNSHHDISDADQSFSGAKIECLNCHGAHNPSAAEPLADPFDPHTSWTGDTSAFCLACHGGGFGPLDPVMPAGVVVPVLDVDGLRARGYALPDACTNGTGDCTSLRGIDSCAYVENPWWVDYTWTHSAHGLDSKRGWPNYSGAPAATLDCTTCHDPHGSYSATNPAGNPYMIRDFVDGTACVDDGYRGAWTGPPWNTFGIAREVQVAVSGVDVDWGAGFCVVCHADWVPALPHGFHEFCTACQTCHAHGASWGEYDWEGGEDDTPCPVGLRSETNRVTSPAEPPIHQQASNVLAVPTKLTDKQSGPHGAPKPRAPKR